MRRPNPADQELEHFKRRFEETGSVQDEEAWIQARLRAGKDNLQWEIGNAVIRRGNLLEDWEPHWEYPGSLGLLPPFPWQHLFVLYATPYWSGDYLAEIQLSSVSGLAVGLESFPMPPHLPVTELAEIWRRSMSRFVVNTGAITLARISEECVCASDEWVLCPTHAPIPRLVQTYGME